MSETLPPLAPAYDVVIAGGGMVGLAQALALDHLSGGQLRILVAESFAVPSVGAGAPAYRPSFDARSSALSHGSSTLLREWALWDELATHSAAITHIHVSERGGFGHTHLQADARGWPALGHVIENAWLGRALMGALRRRPAIDFRSPVEVTGFQPGPTHATVTLAESGQGDTTIPCALLVIAAGSGSQLPARLGIQTSVRDYQRDAIVANVACSEPHRGWAYERFTDWGPMALLPLTAAEHSAASRTGRGQFGAGGTGQGGRMALIWTLPADQTAHLIAASDEQFLRTLQQRFGHRQGRFLHVGQRHTYPLRLVQASEQIRRQLVLIGNAAHTLHPVAGQGFNLALRDVGRLASVLCAARAVGEPLGELPVLQRYRDRQSLDQWKTILFSDRIGALFERGGSLGGHLRRLGLIALDLDPTLKNAFVDQNAGFHPGAAVGLTA